MPRPPSHRRHAALSGLLGALLATALPAFGQEAPRRIVLTPYVGGYFPTRELATVTQAGMPAPANAWLRQRDALAIGATVNYWLDARFAIELGGSYVFSRLTGGSVPAPGPYGLPNRFSGTANVILGAAKLMVDLLPEASPVSLRFGAGPAIISRHGSAFDATAAGRFTDLTDVGAALSLCTRLRILDNLGLRLRVEDYVYESKLRHEVAGDPDRSFAFDARYQNDLVVSAGVQMWIIP
jgi:hypothetical protein